jgi:hypothetical protein
VNVTPAWTQPGDVYVAGWENLTLADPNFVDALGGDYRLTADSPAVGTAQGLFDGLSFVPIQNLGFSSVDWQYDFVGGGWINRSADTNQGEWESDTPELAQGPPSLQAVSSAPETQSKPAPVVVGTIGDFLASYDQGMSVGDPMFRKGR